MTSIAWRSVRLPKPRTTGLSDRRRSLQRIVDSPPRPHRERHLAAEASTRGKRRGSPQAACHQIAAQSLGIAVRIGQCDVAVRPDEVECRAHETGPSHFRLPGERRGAEAQVRRRLRPRRAAARRKHELAMPAKSAGRNYLRSARLRPRAGDRRPGRSRPRPRSAGCRDS